MAELARAVWSKKEAYINQALYGVERAYHDLFAISQNVSDVRADYDQDVMFETPIGNQIRIDPSNPHYTRYVLGMLYDRSGYLRPFRGGRDLMGNAWIKMQCIALNPVSDAYEAKTEAILWILTPNTTPRDNPIEFARAVRAASGSPENNWWNVHRGEFPPPISPSPSVQLSDGSQSDNQSMLMF